MSEHDLTWDRVIKNGLRIYYEREKYAYWYDAKGILLTDEAMDYLVSIHPEHFGKYSPEEIAALKAWSRGRIGYDCTGFIYAVTEGLVGGSADSIYKNSPKKWNNSLNNWAGTMLHKPGHAGLDIGYGFFLHFRNEGSTCELGWSRDYDWKNSCTLAGVDYTGSDKR